MRAIELQAFGGPEVMEVVDRPDPVPAANEVLIDVTAIGVNFADTHVTSNDYLAPQTLPSFQVARLSARWPTAAWSS